jgi:hypothetical protein
VDDGGVSGLATEGYPAAVGKLRVEAINARYVGRFLDFQWLFQSARWELTCGFCKERFVGTWTGGGGLECPYCGTWNLLPLPPFARPISRFRGPRQPPTSS